MKKLINATTPSKNEYVHSSVLAMSDVRGRHVTVVDKLNFSFFYSPKYTQHGPRVKVVFDPYKMRIDNASVQKLCDDWSFKTNPNEKHLSKKDISSMQAFFKKYLILFLLVWNKQIDEPDPADYLTGRITLEELIKDIDFYEDNREEMDRIHSVSELEDFCRKSGLVNMYGN